LTGRYQQRFGHEFNGPNDPVPGYSLDDMGLDPSEVTVAEALREEGYRTMAVGKWHMGTQERFHPSRHGFDEFFGMLSGGRSYFPFDTEKVPAGRALLRNRDVVPEQEVTYTTDMFSDEAVSFIRRTKEQPFFLYLAYNAVHTPMHAKEEDLSVFQEIEDELRRIYAAMTRSLDEGVGRVLDALDQEGLADDTLLFFINDNGGATNNGSNNGPLRGMKGSKWEGGIRVPFMVRFPEKVPAGITFDRPVSSLDIFATCVNAARGSLMAQSNLDGVNLLPFLDGSVVGEPHEMLFWRRGVAAAVRAGDWKLIRSESNPTLLFDLAQDLAETENLAAQHPDKVNELLAALDAWERDLAPPKWTEGEKWERNQVMKHRMEVSSREMEREYP
jgi:arylsulfatase A-like enzyme